MLRLWIRLMAVLQTDSMCLLLFFYAVYGSRMTLCRCARKYIGFYGNYEKIKWRPQSQVLESGGFRYNGS